MQEISASEDGYINFGGSECLNKHNPYDNTRQSQFLITQMHPGHEQQAFHFYQSHNNKVTRTFYDEFVNICLSYLTVSQVGPNYSLFVKKTFDLYPFDLERTLRHLLCFPKIGNFENFLVDKIDMFVLFLLISKL